MRFFRIALFALGLIAWSGGAYAQQVIGGGGGSGGISSVTASVGLAAAAGTCNSGSGSTLSACNAVLTKTGNYSVANADGFDTINCNQSVGCTFTIPQATASGNFAAGWSACFGSQLGTVTLVTSTSNFYGSIGSAVSTFSFPAGITACVQSDGTNYYATGGVANTTTSLPGNTFMSGVIPTVSGTGTPSIAAGSTDLSGEVTGGTLATSVVITFSSTKANIPFCAVTSQSAVASFGYTISTTAITVSVTATSGEKIDYVCFQH